MKSISIAPAVLSMRVQSAEPFIAKASQPLVLSSLDIPSLVLDSVASRSPLRVAPFPKPAKPPESVFGIEIQVNEYLPDDVAFLYSKTDPSKFVRISNIKNRLGICRE